MTERLPSSRHPAQQTEHAVLAQLGARIQARRLDLNMTQRGLATLAGLHRGSIIAAEQGGQHLSLGALARIARAMHTSIAALLEPPGDCGGSAILVLDDIKAQLRCAVAEAAHRRYSYPPLVAQGAMTAMGAMHGIAMMDAIVTTLGNLLAAAMRHANNSAGEAPEVLGFRVERALR